MKRFLCAAVAILLLPLSSRSQPNGKLQLHFIDVGQGDAELLLSPGGETVLIDGGLPGKDQVVNAYLTNHKITNIDYYIASHYHRDHIGCAPKLLTADRVQHLKAAYDRGDDPSDTDSFGNDTTKNYIHSVQAKRLTAQSSATAHSGHLFKLDANSAHPVEIEFFAVNGNGHITNPEKNENDFSVACVIHFGDFSAVLGGDLSGSSGSKYSDIETIASPGFTSPVTLYKVHHHGSQYSSNPTWLHAINPVVGIICCGTRNTYYLPEDSALQRLAVAKIDTYWTETGGKKNPDLHAGATHVACSDKYLERLPDPAKHQYLGSNIVVEVSAGNDTFSAPTRRRTLSRSLIASPNRPEIGELASLELCPIIARPLCTNGAATVESITWQAVRPPLSSATRISKPAPLLPACHRILAFIDRGSANSLLTMALLKRSIFIKHAKAGTPSAALRCPRFSVLANSDSP